MRFAAWWYGLLALAAPLCLALFWQAERARRQHLARLLGAGLAPALADATRHGRRARLIALAVLGLVLALMQPQWGQSATDDPRAGRDLVILLDTSLSMLAEDVPPSRLDAAKQAIGHLVEAIKRRGGDRLALVAFAGRPSLQCPLTHDYDLFLARLAELGPRSAGEQGTRVGDALRHALDHLSDLQPGFADVILLTDGEDHDSAPLDGAQRLALAGVDLYTVGLGDPTLGALVPVVGPDGVRRPLRQDGQEIRSRMDPVLLADLAGATPRGHSAGWDERVLERLHAGTLAHKPQRSIAGEAGDLPAHRYYWFVLAAILLLVAEMFWPAPSWRLP
jgi:Ca-activated chloride channel family protein